MLGLPCLLTTHNGVASHVLVELVMGVVLQLHSTLQTYRHRQKKPVYLALVMFENV
jgi:hypothetical protein